MEHNDCVDFFDAEGRGALDELRAETEKQRLPFDDETLAALIKRHSLPPLVNFCRQYEAELRATVVMLYLEHRVVALDEYYAVPHTGLYKLVRAIDGHAYCLLDAEDTQVVWGLDQQERRALMEEFDGNMYKLMHERYAEKPNKKRATVKLEEGAVVPYDHQRTKKRAKNELVRRDRDECISLNVALALAQQQQGHNEEKHRLEMELVQTKHELALKTKDTEVLDARLQLTQQQQYFQQFFQQRDAGPSRFLALGAAAVRRAQILSINDWLKDSLYPKQDLSQIPLPTEWRYQALFANQLVRYDDIRVMLRVDAVDGARGRRHLLMSVPLTFRYKMLDILHLLRQHNESTYLGADFDKLLAKCPPQYSILLHYCDVLSGDKMQALTSPLNRLNVATVLLHCQAIVQVDLINERARKTLHQAKKKAQEALKLSEKKGDPDAAKKKLKLDVKEKDVECVHLITMGAHLNKPAELMPTIELLDEYYPAPSFYGAGTYVTASLGLRVHNPIFEKIDEYGLGTGSGKCCPLCWTKDRIYTHTAPDAQHSHHLNCCPVLANLSNNEAQVLLALRHAFNGRMPGNKERAEKLRANSTSGACLYAEDFTLNDSTLLRHATDDELASGQHVAGLRLNLPVYLAMRQAAYALLSVQRKKSPLLGALERQITFLGQLLLGPTVDYTQCTIADLLQTVDAAPFVAAKPNRTFNSKKNDTDHLFFSLQPVPSGPRELKHQETVRLELQNQQYLAQVVQQTQMQLQLQQMQPVPSMPEYDPLSYAAQFQEETEDVY